jgi:Na+-transporting NADH:ubiquinone oxidoreductase subunit NqrB
MEPTATREAWPRGATRWWTRLGALDPRYLTAFLITLVLVVGEFQYGILGGYARLATALATTTITEAALSWLLRGRVVNLQSAYITGISLSLLLKPQSGLLWPFALGGFLAIASKYVLRYRDRHLWNPSNFAISALLLLAPGSVAILSHQWGNDLPTNLVIWAFGLAIALRVGVLHITLTYVPCFVLLALLRHQLVGSPVLAEIAPLTGPMYQLFIFFMITDPRTTVSTTRGRMLVAALVALAEAGIRLAADYDLAWLRPLYPSPPILALALVGPLALWWDLRRSHSVGAPPAGIHSAEPVATTSKLGASSHA